MKGCVLYGRYRFANDDKNERWLKRQAEDAQNSTDPASNTLADESTPAS